MRARGELATLEDIRFCVATRVHCNDSVSSSTSPRFYFASYRMGPSGCCDHGHKNELLPTGS